tara:strand:- start:593 stop:907 length:315 start_codon:yes stop_codon:yes gene_type:complete
MPQIRASLIRTHNPQWPVTPVDDLRIAHDENNEHDVNAHLVWARRPASNQVAVVSDDLQYNDGWILLGYLDKLSAATIVGKIIHSKECISQGNACEVPLRIEYE